jgi:hypothetical protein
MVAAKAKSGPPRALAPGFITGETHPTAVRLLDRCFADSTPGAKKIRVTTAAAEGFAGISDRCRQLGAALRIAAAMP